MRFLILFSLFVLVSFNALADGVANRRFPVFVDPDTLYQRYASNFALTGAVSHASLNVRRVIFAVHGTGTSNATTYCAAILDAIDAYDTTNGTNYAQTTAVICPQWVRLSEDEDEAIYDERNVAVSPGDTWAACTGTYDDDLFYGADWIAGDESFTGSGQTGTGGTCTARAFLISSFEVFDMMVDAAADQFPYANDFVITGHSAGGQQVNLYAMTATLPARLPQKQVSFVPMNPGSSPYLSTDRPLARSGATYDFSPVPDNTYCDGLWATSVGTTDQQFSGWTVGSLTGEIFADQDFTTEYQSRIVQHATETDGSSTDGEFAFWDLNNNVQISPNYPIDDLDYNHALYDYDSLPAATKADSAVDIVARMMVEPSVHGTSIPDFTGPGQSGSKYITSMDTAAFSTINDYRHAFVDISPDDDEADGSSSESTYVGGLSYDAVMAAFPLRRYLRVAEMTDTDPNEPSIGQTCPNHVQGDQRMERANAFTNHLLAYFGEDGWRQWAKGDWDILYTNHGGGHTGVGILESPCGLWFTTGIDGTDPVTGQACSNRDTLRIGEAADGVGWTLAGNVAISDRHRVVGPKSWEFSGSSTATSGDIGPGVFTIGGGARLDSRTETGDTIKVQVDIDGAGWTDLLTFESGVDAENTWLYKGGHVQAETSLLVRVVADLTGCGAWVDGFRVTKRQGMS